MTDLYDMIVAFFSFISDIVGLFIGFLALAIGVLVWMATLIGEFVTDPVGFFFGTGTFVGVFPYIGALGWAFIAANILFFAVLETLLLGYAMFTARRGENWIGTVMKFLGANWFVLTIWASVTVWVLQFGMDLVYGFIGMLQGAKSGTVGHSI